VLVLVVVGLLRSALLLAAFATDEDLAVRLLFETLLV